GNPMTYRVVAANAGPSQANGTSVTDTLPAGVSLVSAIPAQGSCSGSSTVVCALGAVVPGNPVTVTITVTPPAAGVITNVVTANTTSTETQFANNTATATITVAPNQPPTAALVASPPTGQAPLGVTFSTAGTTDPEND